MVLINRDDQAARQRMGNARLQAHDEWSKTQKHGRPFPGNIQDSIKKKIDDAQKGDFGPLFVALGIVGTFLTLIVISIISRSSRTKPIEFTMMKPRVQDVQCMRQEVVEHAPMGSVGSAEQYIMDNLDQLGFNRVDFPYTCQIWTDPKATTQDVFDSLAAYEKELDQYNQIIAYFDPVPNLMEKIRHNKGDDVCDALRLHPDGMQGIFPSKQLSLTSSGYVEPLLPPMRHQQICNKEHSIEAQHAEEEREKEMQRTHRWWKRRHKKTQEQRLQIQMEKEQFNNNLMRLAYLVHDFEFMCRTLKPTSKLVLLDMGASLDFHGADQPIMTLLREYETMGFVFDHIYGFEISEKDPKNVYELLPRKYINSYHWINVGVSAEEGSKLNPLESIIKTLDEDDFVVVKLDIDTPAVELPLVCQLLQDKDGIYSKVIDQFYFEHHVHLGELKNNWGHNGMFGTVKDSLELFSKLRAKGIPAHYWP